VRSVGACVRSVGGGHCMFLLRDLGDNSDVHTELQSHEHAALVTACKLVTAKKGLVHKRYKKSSIRVYNDHA
jgi:hypothetical protein